MKRVVFGLAFSLWLAGLPARAEEAPAPAPVPQPSEILPEPAAPASLRVVPAAEAVRAAEPAFAQEGSHAGARAEHGESAEEKKSVAQVIFEHVSDSDEIEFQNPVGHGELRIELPSKRHGNPWMLGPLDISPTKHVIWMWVAALLLVLVFLAARGKAGQIPKGMASFLEMLLLFIRDEIAAKTIGEKDGPRFVPYLATAFFFILFMNLIGLVPYSGTATGNLAITAGLATLTFLVTQYASIRAAGPLGYLKHLTGGVAWWLWPIMVPVEVLGLFTKPFALCVRLFANMVAGHIVIFFLLGLIFILTPLVFPVSVAFALGIYMLELFVALVQAYVFTMLSGLFIGQGVAMGHHAHEAHGEHQKHGEAEEHAAAH